MDGVTNLAPDFLIDILHKLGWFAWIILAYSSIHKKTDRSNPHVCWTRWCCQPCSIACVVALVQREGTDPKGIWMFPKIVGFPPKSSHFNRVWTIINHPFWGSPIFGNSHINVLCKTHFQHFHDANGHKRKFIWSNYCSDLTRPHRAPKWWYRFS